METVKVSWSGGKDRTAAMILHLAAGHKVKAVIFVPMLTDTIPLIRKKHYEFILESKRRFEEAGAEVHITNGITYEEHTKMQLIKGKNKGKPRGSGLGFGFCLFRNYSKIRSGIISVDVGHYDYEDVGIAYDETKRLAQLTDKKRSILYETGTTEKEARKICENHGILSPIYGTGTRDGCAICPNAKLEEFAEWLEDYPSAKQNLIDIDSFCKQYRPDCPPCRGYKWFSDRIEEVEDTKRQMNFFRGE